MSNREIKFRAWLPIAIDDDDNYSEFEMTYDLAFQKYAPLNDLLKNLNRPLMQYTGLLDKTGKEIYEGDFLKLNHWKSSDIFDYTKPFIVKWEFGQINFKQGEHNNFIGSLNGKLGMEIIGNIYENPELLKP